MKELYYATTNKGKVKSLQAALQGYRIQVIQAEMDIPEPRSDDLKYISREKVLYAYERLKKPCVALDAGFYIHSLNGFPKAFVNFALQTIGIDGILDLTRDKPKECEFRNSMAYIDSNLQEPIYFESKAEGTLATEQKGTLNEYSWSKLHLIFIPKGMNKTLAELSEEEYWAWRAKRDKESYTSKFGEWYFNRT